MISLNYRLVNLYNTIILIETSEPNSYFYLKQGRKNTPIVMQDNATSNKIESL